MITKNIYKVPLVESIFFFFFGAMLRLQWTHRETNPYELSCDVVQSELAPLWLGKQGHFLRGFARTHTTKRILSARMHTSQWHARTHTRAKKYLHIHTPIMLTRSLARSHALLLRLTEVVVEVVVGRRFGDDRRAVRDGDVLQV